jgi:glycosyltransferase involved in cell wall biosynthesis
VLAVVNQFPAPSETFILRMLGGLRDAGFDITVAASALRPGAAESGFGLVSTAPWRKPQSLLGAVGPAGVAAAARSMATTLAGSGHRGLSARDRLVLAPLVSTRPAIVHFQLSGLAVAYAEVLDHLRPAKLVVSCRGTAERVVRFRDPTRAPALAAVLAKMDLIHCVSAEIATIVADLGAPPDRILINRPAVPTELFGPLATNRGAHDGPLRVLSVGRLTWVKGFDDGLRALARFRHQGGDVTYRIAGEGDEREKLSFLRNQLGLDDHVTLLGTCDQAQVREHMAWADVVLLPSLSEGISNVALEAMAAGLPVISTDCGGMPEVIDDGVNGFLVPIGGIEEMAARLSALAGDPDLRGRLGAAGLARAQRDFDLSRQVSTFVDAYEALLST